MKIIDPKVDYTIEEVNYLDGVIYTVTLKPLNKTFVSKFEIELDYDFLDSSLVYCNGFQSWTDSKEYCKKDKMKSAYKIPFGLTNKYSFDKYGDSWFYDYSNKRGVFHSFSYGYVRNSDEYYLIGSINEKECYTIIEYDMNNNKIKISSDINRYIDSEFVCLNYYVISGKENKVFRNYKGLFDNIRKVPKYTGYVTWYNYYQNIDEEIILENIRDIEELKYDLFQIDDGYCYFNGDYKDVSFRKFPNGLKHLVDRIHNKGMLAGIWVAPFICEKKSKLAQNHSDYLIKDESGKPIEVGSNWSGMYALDLNKEEVRNYIKDFIHYFTEEMGFDFIKADFLYAACFSANSNLTRAKAMSNAMAFLRECSGDKFILGCGVPLFSAFNYVDYCRVGCDVSLKFDDSWFMKFMHRERISTKNCILNTIYRRHLDGLGFYNDPDVYLLRDENMKMSKEQRHALAFINHLFGSLYLTSDNTKNYDALKLIDLKEAKALVNATNKRVSTVGRKIVISYNLDNRDYQYIYDSKRGNLKRLR